MINLLHNVWGKSFTFSLNWCFLGKIMNLRKIDDHLASPPPHPLHPFPSEKISPPPYPSALLTRISIIIQLPPLIIGAFISSTISPPFHHIHIEYLLNIFFIVKVSFFALQIAHWSMTAQWHVIHRNAEKQIYLETVALRKTYET